MIKERKIAWIQIILFGLAAPFFLFPSEKVVWIAALIPAWLGLRLLNKLPLVPRTLLDWSLLLLTVQVMLTCFIVDSFWDAMPKVFGFLLSVVLFYVLVDLLQSEKMIKAGLLVFMAGGVLFSALTMFGMFRYNVKNFDILFDLSTLIPKIDFNMPGVIEGFNPNAVGGGLILFAPLFVITLSGYFRRRSVDKGMYKLPLFRYFVLLGLFVIIFTLLLTQSRGSWVGLVLGISLLFVFSRKKMKYVLIVIVLAVLLFAVIFGFNDITDRTQGTGQRIVSRMTLWSFAVETISEHPFLGFGMNRIRRHHEVGYELAHVHNHYLHTAAELGIPALIAYFALLIGMAVMCLQTWRQTDRPWVKTAVAGLAGGQLAHMIFGLGDSIPLGAKIGILFWISAALITALFKWTISTLKKGVTE